MQEQKPETRILILLVILFTAIVIYVNTPVLTYMALMMSVGVFIAYANIEAKKQRRLYKEGYGLKFNLFMSHFLLLAWWFDFFYVGVLFVHTANIKAF